MEERQPLEMSADEVLGAMRLEVAGGDPEGAARLLIDALGLDDGAFAEYFGVFMHTG